MHRRVTPFSAFDKTTPVENLADGAGRRPCHSRFEFGEPGDDLLRAHEREAPAELNHGLFHGLRSSMRTCNRSPGAISQSCQPARVVPCEPLVKGLPTDVISRRELADGEAATQVILDKPSTFEHATGLLPRHPTLLDRYGREEVCYPCSRSVLLLIYPVCTLASAVLFGVRSAGVSVGPLVACVKVFAPVPSRDLWTSHRWRTESGRAGRL